MALFLISALVADNLGVSIPPFKDQLEIAGLPGAFLGAAIGTGKDIEAVVAVKSGADGFDVTASFTDNLNIPLPEITIATIKLSGIESLALSALVGSGKSFNTTLSSAPVPVEPPVVAEVGATL